MRRFDTTVREDGLGEGASLGPVERQPLAPHLQSLGCACPMCVGDPAPQYAGDGMGGLNGSKPVWTLDQITANLLRWDARWSPTVIPYAFYESTPSHLAGQNDWTGFVSFTPTQRDATRLALAVIADVANVSFIEVPDNGLEPGASNSRLTFSASTSTAQHFTAYAMVDISEGFDLGDAHRISAAELMFNLYKWTGDFAPGARPFYVAIHEILHGLGLPHPANYNKLPNEEITYEKHAQYAQDTVQFTAMSYFAASASGSNYVGFGETPMLHDVAAMQALYGANMSTRAGDTVYGYGSTAGRPMFNFAINPTPILTIWDAGGTDTLNLSGSTQAATLDLNPGAFSDAFGMTNNISIAFGAWIENAVGGSGSDVLRGNAVANRLTGGAGDDQLQGGGGDDVLVGGLGSDSLQGGDGFDEAVLTGRSFEYRLEQAAGGGWTLIHPTGKDQVFGVEAVRADNGVFDWSGFAAKTFNPMHYLAAYADLRAAFGTGPGAAAAATAHFQAYGYAEGRNAGLFDPLVYAAGYKDLALAYGADAKKALDHWLAFGISEGREFDRFDPLAYLASHPDLVRAYRTNGDAGLQHYLAFGVHEGRATDLFDPLVYAASHRDLALAFGTNGQAANLHYLTYGFDEGRGRGAFDPLIYVSTHRDLALAFRTDAEAALSHYLVYGAREGRAPGGFDPDAYLLSYGDLGAAGLDRAGALQHWLFFGVDEGRGGDARFGREQGSHALAGSTHSALDWAGDHDWFALGADGTVTLTASGAGSVSIHDQFGRELARQTFSGSPVALDAPGGRYVVVTGDGGGYRLDFTPGAASPWDAGSGAIEAGGWLF